MALITAPQAREKIPSLSGTGEDTLLDTMIAAAGVAFARYCGYPAASVGGNPSMEAATYTRYMDGPRPSATTPEGRALEARCLTLEVWPVNSITSIEDDPTWDFDGASYLVASTDYTLRDGNRGLVVLKSTAAHGQWSSIDGAIKVVYSGGFSAGPATLKELCKHAVRHAYDLRATQGKTNLSQGGVSIGLRDEDYLPALVKQGLDNFRLPRSLL